MHAALVLSLALTGADRFVVNDWNLGEIVLLADALGSSRGGFVLAAPVEWNAIGSQMSVATPATISSSEDEHPFRIGGSAFILAPRT